MARLASSDSFLPSGAHDMHHFSLSQGGDTSVISPLSLPRNATHYFEPQGRPALPTSNSYRARGRQSNHFFSPRLAPTSTQMSHQLYLQQRKQKQTQHRSASLSPTFRGTSVPTSRAASADSTASASNLYAQRIAILEKQNAAIRQAWENERKYLEANRARAEEVYQEERTIWEAERAILLEEIALLRLEVTRARISGIPECDEDVIGLRGGGDSCGHPAGSDSVPVSSGSSEQEQALTQATSCHSKASQVLARLATGASGPSPPLEARISPSQQFQPRSHVNSPPQEPLDAAPLHESREGTPVPTIDVQIIHPDLEGIPIKKTAVERSTFTDTETSRTTSKSGSARSSPPLPSSSPDGARSRPQEKDILKVLAAPAPQRLVINAGHTPNHSLSILPSAATTAAHTTASSSGEVTPTTTAPDGCLSRGSAGKSKQVDESSDSTITVGADAAGVEPSDMGSLTPPEGDQPLKGFLGIRNQPAHDEIFFRKLDRKLEAIKSEGDVVPTVLKNADESLDGANPLVETATGADIVNNGQVGSEQQPEASGQGSQSCSGSDTEELNLEIPLKFKKSNNFGAPLGYGFSVGSAQAH
ncbi:uncharacterized protein PpBr36_09328 [Pyricularia pennisetigena]|uniref:uncharacterized protein n=1 Tax=Pyricularia pennisetigena TaxID=1578925 RepID=UPI0011540BCE|nr:uncharacterized protein PpBr36_09328 [Pyricularia pennisetigena]TLS21824.1 hypothetical protein PpBr36_09328 [Pyricularia pennisetigena]